MIATTSKAAATATARSMFCAKYFCVRVIGKPDLISSKETCCLLRIIPPPIVELGRARVTMASGFLHVFELSAVFERGGDEGSAHRMCRVAAIEAERGGIFAQDAIDRIGVHTATLVSPFAVVLERPKQGPVEIGALTCGIEIGAQPGRGLRIDRE